MTQCTSGNSVYDKVHRALVALDIDAAKIRPETDLKAELDIDSTELVEIAASVTAGSGRRVDGKTLKGARTVSDLVRLLEEPPSGDSASTSEGADRPMYHTEHSVTIDAPLEIVWEVLYDVEGYARLFPSTLESTLVEEGEDYQVVRRLSQENGQTQTWLTRRDIDLANRVIAFRRLDEAPLFETMTGEWRLFPYRNGGTQLVATHDYRFRAAVDGRIAGRYTPEEAAELVRGNIDRGSSENLAAFKRECERRHQLALTG
ncbi:SRPBCC family protein [Marinactinospora thermotolerans]|uniref:Polyketide cyclase / dehydrase and lipid transport n=1 Tax=Marinactinospora thermotolerans DSM 45154 TaxID=1122192 RepID=A0A1T4NBU7_9ACTN|nr:SRPBCC family protein [Marinactinospora thermotolerans]SJZ76585.1 Polyketide cyclase / dehydrase and lipid transport [Marinactinospora thermotolerans DSM 45154]